MSNGSLDIKLRRKAVFLVGDLAESQLQNTGKDELPIFKDRFFLKSVVDLIVVLDLDLQEKVEILQGPLTVFSSMNLGTHLFLTYGTRKICFMFQALTAIQTLLQLKSIEPQILKEFCGLEETLERMKLQLEESMADEYKRDYAADVESIRGEVELIFRQKLGLL